MNAETIVDLFEHAVQTHRKPNTFLTKRAGRYEPVSADEVRKKVYLVCAGLASYGIKKGDRVALLSENRPEWAINDLGILYAGAINVPVFPSLPAAQIRDLLLDCKPRAILLSNAIQLEKILSIARQVDSLEIIVFFEGNEKEPPPIISFTQLLASGARQLQENPGLLEECRRHIRPEDIASIIYTSGTTGIPKGVMLSHGNIVSNVHGCAEAIRIDSSDTALSFLPLSHIFERTADYLMLYRGATIAYAENFETVAQNMLEVRPTLVACMPRFCEKIYARIEEARKTSPPLKQQLMSWALGVGRRCNQFTLNKKHVPKLLSFKRTLAERLVFSKLKQRLGGRLRFLISGGAPLDQELAEFFFAAGILILEGYGLTETSPVIAVNQPAQFKFGSVGPPLSNVDVKIAPDGEILTRGPAVMKGYYENEADTREALKDGWFHTGDIGSIDEEGFLKITDRKKDIIITASGKNVAPQKIENLLRSNSHFLNIVVVGNKRPYISALVVPNPERLKHVAKELGLQTSDYVELVHLPQVHKHFMEEIQRLTPDLAPFEKIKKIALLESDFSIENGEVTPTLKIRRRVVESKYKNLIDQIYTSGA